MQELIRATEQMKVLIVEGQRHVIRPFKRRLLKDSKYFFPKANYLDRGMALCGVIKPSETLEQFKQDWINRKLVFSKKTDDVENLEEDALAQTIGWKNYSHMCKQKTRLSQNGMNAINMLFEDKGLEKPFIN